MLRPFELLFSVFLSTAIASSVHELKISSVASSEKTSKVLFNSNGTKLDYSFYTNVSTYNDGSKQKFLMGEVVLSNVITYYAQDDDEIRVSIGWRNPQEDAYDITSFTFKYNTDISKITCDAVDGYAYGSIDSHFYNWKYFDDASAETRVQVFKGDGSDYNGFFNKTIKQWTDKKSLDGLIDYRADQYGKDQDPTNDITILDFSVTERTAITGTETATDKDSVTQTFNVTYSRPFKGSDLNDIDLETDTEYNLTSAYGCYRPSDAAVNNEWTDYNPNALSETTGSWAQDTDPIVSTGCFGVWQAINGVMVFTKSSAVGGKNIEESTSGEMLNGTSPENRLTIDLTGSIETQITVLLKDSAQYQTFKILSVLGVIVSAYI